MAKLENVSLMTPRPDGEMREATPQEFFDSMEGKKKKTKDDDDTRKHPGNQ